jgi:hypothetical protein
MNRDYESGKADDINYFTGIEIEQTPAFGAKTLFVTGIQSAVETGQIANHEKCSHIYLGANHSFNPANTDEWEDWNDMVEYLTKEGFLVTLDYDVKYHERVLDIHWNDNNLFISQISIKIPNIDKLNYNACIKIDDKDFKATNPGVWVHTVHDLTNRKNFTGWKEYESDTIIG